MRGYKRLIEAQQSFKPGELLLGKDIASGGIKRYYIFPSVEEFLREQENHRKHYYEVLNGKQRLYFDIDIPIPGKSIENTAIVDEDRCRAFLDRFTIHLYGCLPGAEINVYTSEAGNSQRYSFHIIVLNYYASDNIECKRRVQIIIDSYNRLYRNAKDKGVYSGSDVVDPYVKYIDISLYKRSQLFRVLGSSKIDKYNTKIQYRCTRRLKHGSNEVDKIQELKDSLICHYI